MTTEPTPARTYRTIAYVAAQFQVSKTTVRTWIHGGDLDAIISANGRVIRITDEAIDDLEQRLTHSARKRKGARSASSQS